MSGWRTVIGLEVHVQLATESKLFCRCPNRPGAEPNSLICEICTGQPGALPVPNERALRLAVRAGLVLGCTVQSPCRFDRKSYFYPDLPKGYQISQLDLPLLVDGALAVPIEDGVRRVAVVRAHVEEDAGKTLHPEGEDRSLVDLNRAGVPLLEIVTAPDLRSPAEARLWLERLRLRLRYADVSDCDMENGTLRCDANVSVVGAGTRGERVEIKNLNSFRFVEAALEYEVRRHRALLERGEEVGRETRGYSEKSGETYLLRGKEEEQDYRYFPDPDLPDVRIPEPWIEAEREALPEPPEERRRRYVEALSLPPETADAIVAEPVHARLFEGALARVTAADAALVAHLLLQGVLTRARERTVSVDSLRIAPEALAEVADRVADGGLSSQAARRVLHEIDASGQDPKRVVERLGLQQLNDEGELRELARRAIAAKAEAAEDYRQGKSRALDALVGEVMRSSRGRANPKRVRQLLIEFLAEE